ncbi:hypothetical protein ACFQ38_16120 [Sporosarcina contaminans]|uniref:Uncharacterized protein n=1 Tax=Sporosarcina contaminans TaxID=633403 RepID=A0ABW3U1G0_9BACL
MSVPMIRRRQKDGTLGPLEPMFPDDVETQIDPNLLIVLQAMAGMQEQIDMLTEKLEEKGGAK